MKKVLTILPIILGFCFLVPFKAQAVADTEYIKTFQSDVVLDKDASILVKETINYHFPSEKHGIYREIPVNYKTSGAFVRPTLFQLKDLYYYKDSNPSETFTSYDKSQDNGYVILKIGDAEKTIVGDYTYVIEYKLVYAINYFQDHDELYLNVTGNGWEVPINTVITNISLPGKITNKLCYTGEVGSTTQNCTMVEGDNNRLTVSAQSLYTYEGLTAVVAMPKDTIANTTNQQRVLSLIANIGIFLPVPVLILALIMLKKYNKNKKITVIPNYDVPKGINPLLGGYIYKKTLANNIISAQIIQLAINKFLKIKQVSNKNYDLIKTDKQSPEEKNEKILYEGLFGTKETVSLKSLSNKFFNTVQTLKASVEKQLYEEEYLSSSQRKVQGIYMAIGIIGLILTFFAASSLADNAASSWFWGSMISFIIIIIFSSQIDKRTVKGNEMFYELEGLKLYINTAEKHRIEFHNDPKKYIGVFEKLLPFAMIFGLEKKWAKEFEDIYLEQPSWYDGNGSMFNSYLMISSLNHMHQEVASHATPTNSANGFASSRGGSGFSGFSGGSSGGGFGGGGGGSW